MKQTLLPVWPEEGVARAGDARNRCFEDLRGLTWRDVDEALRVERALLPAYLSGDEDFDAMWDDSPLGDQLLDFGVISASYALNAGACPTFISCNGHGRTQSYVGFWARPERLAVITPAAALAGVDLSLTTDGALVASTGALKAMICFAAELRARSIQLRNARQLRALGARTSERGAGTDGPVPSGSASCYAQGLAMVGQW
jgi:hypothetical protein